jgi:hypothetical protein
MACSYRYMPPEHAEGVEQVIAAVVATCNPCCSAADARVDFYQEFKRRTSIIDVVEVSVGAVGTRQTSLLHLQPQTLLLFRCRSRRQCARQEPSETPAEGFAQQAQVASCHVSIGLYSSCACCSCCAIRFADGDFDLDLSYCSPQLILTPPLQTSQRVQICAASSNRYGISIRRQRSTVRYPRTLLLLLFLSEPPLSQVPQPVA